MRDSGIFHALNERTTQFYEYYGFKILPVNPLDLMLGVATKHRKCPAIFQIHGKFS